MSVAASISDYFKNTIYQYAHAVFAQLGHALDKDNICHDLAQSTPACMKSAFYVKGLNNVSRKNLNALVLEHKKLHPELVEFKVKSKRPDKEVRFYIEINKSDS
ncbi:hypothetical protein EBR43_05650 [bacterium]|nr:hypothetical protein [bacterium]